MPAHVNSRKLGKGEGDVKGEGEGKGKGEGKGEGKGRRNEWKHL